MFTGGTFLYRENGGPVIVTPAQTWQMASSLACRSYCTLKKKKKSRVNAIALNQTVSCKNDDLSIEVFLPRQNHIKSRFNALDPPGGIPR